MKRTLLIAAVVAATTAACCKKTEQQPSSSAPPQASAPAQKQEAPAAPAAPKSVTLDLGSAGLDGATIQAPQGATAKSSFGDVVIAVGEKPLMQVHPTRTDIIAFKKAVQESQVNKLEAILVDEPDTLVYEIDANGKGEVHFVANVLFGEDAWSCEDVKGPAHTKDDVDQMLRMCRSITRK